MWNDYWAPVQSLDPSRKKKDRGETDFVTLITFVQGDCTVYLVEGNLSPINLSWIWTNRWGFTNTCRPTANISPSAPMSTTLHWWVAKRLYSSIKAKCWASFWKQTEVLQQQHSYLWRKFCFRSARFQVEETLWLQTALHSVLLVLLSPARNQSLDLENCSQRPFIRHENKTARSRRSAGAFSSSQLS